MIETENSFFQKFLERFRIFELYFRTTDEL